MRQVQYVKHYAIICLRSQCDHIHIQSHSNALNDAHIIVSHVPVLDACRYNVYESRPYPAAVTLCLNDGICQTSQDVAGLFTCLCIPGYTGTRCETGSLTSSFISTFM